MGSFRHAASLVPRGLAFVRLAGPCRVAGRYCYLPAPSELDVRVAPHPAQAFTNAPCGTRPFSSLHDTRLEPMNRTPDLIPVDGMPVGRMVGSRTGKHFCCRHICLSP